MGLGALVCEALEGLLRNDGRCWLHSSGAVVTMNGNSQPGDGGYSEGRLFKVCRGLQLTLVWARC